MYLHLDRDRPDVRPVRPDGARLMEAAFTGAGLALTGVLILGWVVYRQSVRGMIARAVPFPDDCPTCGLPFEAGRAVVRCGRGHPQHRSCGTRGAECPVPGCVALMP